MARVGVVLRIRGRAPRVLAYRSRRRFGEAVELLGYA
jgi:hypothetical protein